ncbi:MAG: hypothetical protein V3V20_04430 [Algisphaera sp.]
MGLHDNIQSVRILKLKGLLFFLLALLTAAGLLWENLHWRPAALLAICIWASCRTYYFLFYVLEHYAGAGPYAGLWDALRGNVRD